MKKKLLSLVLVCVLCIMAVSGCGKSENSSSGEKTLTAGTAAGYFSATDLDPANEWNGWYMSFFGMTETLFRLDENFVAQPWLVEKAENIDDQTWKLTLKDNVNFSNGEKMTADAVKKCFERTYQVNSRAKETLDIAEMTVEGQTLTIKTKEATPALSNDLCDPVFSVYFVGDNVNYAEDTPCTGPFVKEAFSANEEITVVKNENYWGGTPKLDKAVLKVINDADALTMAVQSGELDMAVAVPASSLEVLSDTSKYTTYSNTTTRGHFLRFNMNKTAVQDKAVREAISYCIDRDNYCEVIARGTCTPSYGIFPSNLSYGSMEHLKPIITKYDVEAAKKVLSDAGYVDSNNDGYLEKDGQKLTLKLAGISTRSEFKDLCDVLQSTLKEVGIDLQVQLYEKLETKEEYAAADCDISLDSKAMAPTGNPQYFINTSFVTGASANFGHYSNSTVDQLAKQLETTFGTEERDNLIFQIEQQILNDTSYIVFADQNYTCIGNTKVTGFTADPSEYYFLNKDIGIK